MEKKDDKSITIRSRFCHIIPIVIIQCIILLVIAISILAQYKARGTVEVNIRILFALIFFVSVFADLFWLFQSLIVKHKQTILYLGSIVGLVSMPLFCEGINGVNEQDLIFHLTRIESIVAEIKNGVFPIRMGSIYFNGYGYPVSIYYGDILLYIPALLRIAGIPVVTAYKLYLFMVNGVSTLIAYFSFKGIFKNKYAASAATAAYMTATYRIVNLYVRSAVGECSAIMFFPLVALAVYRIYTQDVKNWKEYRVNALLLSVGMSGIVLTHVLSAEMMIFVLALICIVLWRKTLRITTIKVYLLAIVQTLLLCAYFIIPFLDYFLNVETVINSSVSGIRQIQSSGVYFSQIFAFWQDIFGFDRINVNERMNLSLGILLTFALLWAIYLWIERKATKEMKFYTIFSLLTLFLASSLFPWDFLAEHTSFGRLLSQIQFPWRYLGFSMLFMALLFGVLCKEIISNKECYTKYLVGGVIIICFVVSSIYTSQYNDNATMNYMKTARELEPYTSDDLYRLIVSDPDTGEDVVVNVVDLSTEFYGEQMEEIVLIERKGSFMRLYCKANQNENGYVEAPLFNYKGYHVFDSHNQLYEIVEGTNGRIAFRLPAGYDGEIMIDFVEPWYWKVGNAISLIYIIGLIGCIMYKRKRVIK